MLKERDKVNTKSQIIRENKLKGSLIRSRARQIKWRGKSHKFFLNLENRNFVSENIRESKINDNTILK